METGWAKVNLTLDVLGKRSDGYHELRSLVVFAATGDRLLFSPGDGFSLTVTGPFADEIKGENLIRTVAKRLMTEYGVTDFGTVCLEKNLPVASGIGGGSADAAAFIRLFEAECGIEFSAADVAGFGQVFGADVPVCYYSSPMVMGGIGEEMCRLDTLPDMALVLVNPGCAVETRAVFERLQAPELDVNFTPPLLFAPSLASFDEVISYMEEHDNGLYRPALVVEPTIGLVMDVLAGLPRCAIAQLSGSGATCFGLFPSLKHAEAGALKVRTAYPDWWVAAAPVRSF